MIRSEKARVAQAVARLATTRMVGGSRPTPAARAKAHLALMGTGLWLGT